MFVVGLLRREVVSSVRRKSAGADIYVEVVRVEEREEDYVMEARGRRF
jgi:hypothetical protein